MRAVLGRLDAITAILQSRAGYLWLGTYHGLARFDGDQFHLVDLLPQSSQPSVAACWAARKGACGSGQNIREFFD